MPETPLTRVLWASGNYDRSVARRGAIGSVLISDIYNGHHEYNTVADLIRNVPIPDDATLMALLVLKYGKAHVRNTVEITNIPED